MNGNYFDTDEEDALQDAYYMIHDPDCEYQSLAEVIMCETSLPAALGE